MGSIEGFIKVDRKLPETVTPAERVKNYQEIYIPHSDELTKSQASRCMDCGVPFCHNGCPLGNLIPDFNEAVYKEDWERATSILLETNNFPEFTGRICPAPCEGSCVLGINKPPVSIELIEKSIIEKAFASGYIKPKAPKARRTVKIAVIGSGPAGLAAADQLNKAGYQVDVYERDSKPGGLLRFGIPDFKLEKWVVERRVQLMEKEGVRFITNYNVGVDITGDELRTAYDVILLSGGSTIPRDLKIPGRELNGVHFAMEFLSQQNKRVSGIDIIEPDISANNKNVIVIGGGDTGSDCIGTSNRQGAKSILQLELLGEPPVNRNKNNPWPEWPMTLRTSSSHEEGSDREWSILTKAFEGDENGDLKFIRTIKIKWEGNSFQEIEGTEKRYPCDLALLAMGFIHPQKEGLIEQLGIEIDNKGNVSAHNYRTNIPNIYVAGDMRRGQSLVVWAISEGREAARAINKEFSGKDLPSKQVSGYEI